MRKVLYKWKVFKINFIRGLSKVLSKYTYYTKKPKSLIN